MAQGSNVTCQAGTQYVSEADHVVVLRDGEVAESGNYKTLMAQNGALASMMQDVQDDEDPQATDAGVHSSQRCVTALLTKLRISHVDCCALHVPSGTCVALL